MSKEKLQFTGICVALFLGSAIMVAPLVPIIFKSFMGISFD